jgi:hypothetical protein
MSTDDSNSKNNDSTSDICANCGKGEEGANSLKACTACKLVKYIAIEIVKLLINLNTRRLVRRGLRNYTMRNSSSSLHHFMEIAQSASYECLRLIQGGGISLAAEKLYAVDVRMHLSMITRAMYLLTLARFVELRHPFHPRK